MTHDTISLQEHIGAYLDHLERRSYICDLAAEAGLSALTAALLDMLASDDQEMVAVASMFIGDATTYVLVRNGEYHCTVPKLHDALVAAGLFDLLSSVLYRPNASIRHTAIQRLSRSGSWTKGGRLLAAALPFYLDHFPLELPSLLHEITWRQRWRNRLDLVRQAARHPLHLTRWATVDHLESKLDKRNPRAGKAKQLLRQLAQDRNPRVQAEARGHLQELRGAPPHTLPEIRQRLAERDYTSFSSVSISITNFLSVTGAPDYTQAMVDNMVRWIEQRPFVVGEDGDAYYRAFGEFHASMQSA